MRARVAPWALALVLLAWPPALGHAQPSGGELEEFVGEVARLWGEGNVAGLIERIPETDPLRLDTGSGLEPSTERHAAAALRDLFANRRTVGARTVQVTLASAQPPAGFGQIAWTYRDRGAPGEQVRSIYVAAVWQSGVWRITELRLMP
ncbi:MAG TPA: hypothetical protein VMN39_08265 [Longimicrobiaceae bacterium]|nr:hypothetical protein [Longimicrobiaceae bacterium]